MYKNEKPRLEEDSESGDKRWDFGAVMVYVTLGLTAWLAFDFDVAGDLIKKKKKYKLLFLINFLDQTVFKKDTFLITRQNCILSKLLEIFFFNQMEKCLFDKTELDLNINIIV
jgi:hypothetical protein